MSDQVEQQKQVSFQCQWNWKVVLFVVCFLPVLVNLAFWQLDREKEKSQLLDTYNQRRIADPQLLSALPKGGEHLYVRADVTGKYDNTTPLLLDNRVRRGRPGYEVISPFQTSDGQWLLVNRGWVGTGLDRSILPEINDVPGDVTLKGYLYKSLGKQIMLGEDIWKPNNGPVIIQNASPELISEKLGQKFYDYHLRLEADSPGALETGWVIVNVQPSKHTGYAVQWSALAVALIILGLFANSNLGSVIRCWRQK